MLTTTRKSTVNSIIREKTKEWKTSNTLVGGLFLINLILKGLYSTSGIDVLRILSKVINRQNPVIELGPIDLSASFIIVDAKKYDLPILYASNSFEKLTEYTLPEILGKNCRFLQSPDGLVVKGAPRLYSDNSVIYQLRESIEKFKECQYLNINFRKSGDPFVNLITVVPVRDELDADIVYFIGFQADILSQTKGILKKMEDGSYIVSFSGDYYEALRKVKFGNMLNQETMNKLNIVIENGKPSIPTSPEKSYSDASMHSSPPNPSFQLPDDFEKTLIEESPDIIQIMSARGVILYSTRMQVNIGKNFDELVFGSDMIMMQRQMKACSVGDTFSIIVRILTPPPEMSEDSTGRNDQDWVWHLIKGRKFEMKNRKKGKCFILSLRRTVVDDLPLLEYSQEGDIWGKCTSKGIVLYSAWTDWYGLSLYDIIVSEYGLRDVIEGFVGFMGNVQVSVRVKMLESGIYLFHVSESECMIDFEKNDIGEREDAGSFIYETNRLVVLNKGLIAAIEELS